MVDLLRQAHEQKCQIVVFPELALTTFFPRWLLEEGPELDAFFEAEMPNEEVRPLFEAAQAFGIGFYLGYAELVGEGAQRRHFNSSILVHPDGHIVGKYRKVHLPGHDEVEPERAYQHLEKRYFEVGDLGFPVWKTMGGYFGMCLCNDRRWPETYRVMGLQGVEMVLLGYNTPTIDAFGCAEPELKRFHNHLSMQAGAYQNATFVVGTAKAGVEDGHGLIGESVIVDPEGRIIAQAETEGDELVVADCDLDACLYNKAHTFNFAAHRRIEHYGRITEQVGAISPETEA